ncbi:MAG: hypothetical protein IPN79_01250 [Saprospiraceae bacterium]|nr:hypothetical protein [Saprospiraceae bacterium]
MNLKYILQTVAFFILIGMMSCKERGDNKPSEEQAKVEVTPKEYPRGVNETWATFEKEAGKKPSDVGLMKSAELQERIKSLLKDDYQRFQKDWNQETPLVIEDRIIFFTGCKADDCKANKYAIYLDVNDNNINIVNFTYGRAKSYAERYIIGLPAGLLKEYEAIRAFQGL